MAREVTFSPGSVVSSGFLNDRQDLESALSFIRVEQSSATVIRVPVVADGSVGGQTPAIINGQPRLSTTVVSLALSTGTQGSTAVTFDVYATLTGTLITDGFVLQLVARTGGTPYGGAAGSAPANSRKVAELDWTGAVINALRNTTELAGHANQHRFGGGDPLPAGSVDVSMLAATVTNKLAYPGDLKMSLQVGDHGQRADGTYEWVLITPGRRLSQALYPNLYTAMGSPGVDGGGTYALPDVAGRTVVAAGTASGGTTARVLGAKPGAEKHGHAQPGLTVPGLVVPAEGCSVTVPAHLHGLASAHAPFYIGVFGSAVFIQTIDVAAPVYGGLAQFNMPLSGSVSSGVTSNGSMPIYGTTDNSSALSASGATVGTTTNGATTGPGATDQPTDSSMQPSFVGNAFVKT